MLIELCHDVLVCHVKEEARAVVEVGRRVVVHSAEPHASIARDKATVAPVVWWGEVEVDEVLLVRSVGERLVIYGD
jgi:hypothetical protein